MHDLNEIIKRYTRLGSSPWQHGCFGSSSQNVKIVIFPRAPGRWCHVILIVVKTKQRPRDPKPWIMPTGSPPTKWPVYTCTCIRTARAALMFDYLWKTRWPHGAHTCLLMSSVHRHTGSSRKEGKYWNGNGHNMTKHWGYTYQGRIYIWPCTYVQNQSLFLFKKSVTIFFIVINSYLEIYL